MNMRFLCFCIAISLSVVCCDLFNPHQEKVAITVGDRSITVGDFKRDLNRLISSLGMTDQEAAHVLNLLINKIVDEYLILEYGRTQGMAISDTELIMAIKDIKKDYPERRFEEMLLQNYMDFEDWKEEFRRQLLISRITTKAMEGITTISFEEIKSYFDDHKEAFRYPQMVRFRQIIARTREEAEKVVSRLNKGEELEGLSKEYSLTTESEKLGGTGWIVKGMLDESMENLLFSLPVGKISPVVKTPYGYHIFKVLERRSEGVKSLSEVIKEIRLKISDHKGELFYRKWLEELRVTFPVKINEEVMRRLEFA
ncbi:MAG: peptidyl-prolyl cis-trans isomerase [Pseudomonadota bacterium]